MDTFANRLKELRHENGLSLDRLASLCGVSKTTMWKYEIGAFENPRISMVKHVAGLFDVSPSYMIGFSDNRHDEKI